jgi:ABC-type multidrug transport system ATPase subunit
MVTDARVAVWMNMVGLIHCKDTNVGDAMNRGVSGGEKKRVTLAEMLVGPRNVMFLDEISTGLDSATLFTIVKSLSQVSTGSPITAHVL